MGVYLLNISVDTADPNPEHIPEDLSFNDQESIVEIILEQILGYEDAIKEYDDHDTQDHNEKKSVKIDLLVHVTKTNSITHTPLTKRKEAYPGFDARLTSEFKEIESPPPEV